MQDCAQLLIYDTKASLPFLFCRGAISTEKNYVLDSLCNYSFAPELVNLGHKSIQTPVCWSMHYTTIFFPECTSKQMFHWVSREDSHSKSIISSCSFDVNFSDNPNFSPALTDLFVTFFQSDKQPNQATSASILHGSEFGCTCFSFRALKDVSISSQSRNIVFCQVSLQLGNWWKQRKNALYMLRALHNTPAFIINTLKTVCGHFRNEKGADIHCGVQSNEFHVEAFWQTGVSAKTTYKQYNHALH